MNVETNKIVSGRIELNDKILMLIFGKFLVMGNTRLKFDISIFSGDDDSKMDKFGIFRIDFFDNNNEVFGFDFGFIDIDVAIKRVQLRVLGIVFGESG